MLADWGFSSISGPSLVFFHEGITRIILPSRNRKDVEADLPKEVRDSLEIHYVSTIWNALDVAFGNSLFEHVVGSHEGVEEGRRMMTEFEDSRL